jgi:hypothetical protein
MNNVIDDMGCAQRAERQSAMRQALEAVAQAGVFAHIDDAADCSASSVPTAPNRGARTDHVAADSNILIGAVARPGHPLQDWLLNNLPGLVVDSLSEIPLCRPR